MSSYRARVEIQHRAPASKEDAEKGRNSNPPVVFKAGDPVDPAVLGAKPKDMQVFVKRGMVEELDDDGNVLSSGFGPAVVPPRDYDPTHNAPAVSADDDASDATRPTIQITSRTRGEAPEQVKPAPAAANTGDKGGKGGNGSGEKQ